MGASCFIFFNQHMLLVQHTHCQHVAKNIDNTGRYSVRQQC